MIIFLCGAWNCQNELLNYLKSDVNGLYEVMMIMSKAFFEKYNINMTKYKTLPALVMAIFTSNFIMKIEY